MASKGINKVIIVQLYDAGNSKSALSGTTYINVLLFSILSGMGK